MMSLRKFLLAKLSLYVIVEIAQSPSLTDQVD